LCLTSSQGGVIYLTKRMIHFSGTVIALFLLFEIIREILLRKPIIAGFFIFATIIWTLVFSRFSYKLFKPKDVQKIAYKCQMAAVLLLDGL
jgi:hypothetical protein